MAKSLSILVTLLLSGCASQQITQEERDWRRAVDRENWHMCQLVYANTPGAYTISNHPHDKHRPHRPYEVKEDLMDNGCRRVLGEYWVEY